MNLLYVASYTANTLDQVHCKQRCNIHMHYIWNDKYFKIYCHFVLVSKSPYLALHTLVNLNHNLISRTFQDQSHFPGPGNFRKNNSGLSGRRGNPVISCSIRSRNSWSWRQAAVSVEGSVLTSRAGCRAVKYTCWLSADDHRRPDELSHSASVENPPHSPATQDLTSRNRPTVTMQLSYHHHHHQLF